MGTRTPNPLLAKQVLYQLSYNPERRTSVLFENFFKLIINTNDCFTNFRNTFWHRLRIISIIFRLFIHEQFLTNSLLPDKQSISSVIPSRTFIFKSQVSLRTILRIVYIKRSTRITFFKFLHITCNHIIKRNFEVPYMPEQHTTSNHQVQ